MELAYPNASVMELEEKLDKSIMQIFSEAQAAKGGMPRLKVMAAIIWAGLIEKNDITFDEVVENFSLKDADTMVVPALEELTEAMDFEGPTGEGKKNSTPKKAVELEES